MKHATKKISARLPMNIYEELKAELAETRVFCMNDLLIRKILDDKRNKQEINRLKEVIQHLEETNTQLEAQKNPDITRYISA